MITIKILQEVNQKEEQGCQYAKEVINDIMEVIKSYIDDLYAMTPNDGMKALYYEIYIPKKEICKEVGTIDLEEFEIYTRLLKIALKKYNMKYIDKGKKFVVRFSPEVMEMIANELKK